MKMEVILAGKEWKEKILAVADEAFGEWMKEGFAAFIPDVYGKNALCEKNHFLVLEDGEIQALTLVEPITFVQEGQSLTGIGVGTVSVAGPARGKGYMKLLMRTIQDWMDEKGYAFAVLGGQRQRYAYWGYEPTGARFTALFSRGSVKHALTEACTGGLERELTLEIMEEGSPAAEQAYELFCAQPVHTLRRKERFATHLRAGRSTPFCIRRNGTFAGYLTAVVSGNEIARITELELADEKLFPAFLKAFQEQKAPEGFEMNIPFDKISRVQMAEKLCEYFSIRNDYQYYIADMAKVLAFSMKHKQAVNGLADGEWAFETEKGCFHMSVQSGEIKVSRMDGPIADDKKIFRGTHNELTRYLFGPYAPIADILPGVPAGWLPLPLYLPDADAV